MDRCPRAAHFCHPPCPRNRPNYHKIIETSLSLAGPLAIYTFFFGGTHHRIKSTKGPAFTQKGRSLQEKDDCCCDQAILLMVQTNPKQPPNMHEVPCKEWDISTISAGDLNPGFLVAEPTDAVS